MTVTFTSLDNNDKNYPENSDSVSVREGDVRLVPDVSFLLAGEYSQSGFNLIITNPSGEQFIVVDYFAQQPPPNLMLASGVGLSPEMVRALLHLPFTTAQAGPWK